MATFTSYQDLLQAARDKLAGRDPTVRRYRTPDGLELEFAEPAKLVEMLGWLEERAAAEAAGTSRRARRRTFARGGPV